MRIGKPLPPVKTVPPPTPEEISRVVRNWSQNTPNKYQGLLIAMSVELMDTEDSDWYWDQVARVYINGKAVSIDAKEAGFIFTALMVGRKLTDMKSAGLMGYGQLAEGLKAGTISLADWTEGMRELIRLSQETGILVANGGVEFVTQADWNYMATQIEKQYQFLDKFAADIAEDPQKWLTGRLDNRMRLYQESAYSSYQNAIAREAKLNGMEEECWILGVADHCPGCLEQASLGWVPIGTLPEIGSQECSNNCHCEKEFRMKGDE